ncbi:MAG: helix-turn-helix domain-containing protein [Chloroflexota bacterium]|nr:helix-turn-helix domain-containing protein [Chloroflexota bacterium]
MPDETMSVGSADRSAGGDERGAAAGRGNPVAGVAEIVARIPLAEAGREMVDAFRSEIPAFERLSGTSQGDIVEGVERNLRRWQRWVETGVVPPDSDFDPLREWARARATEGVRLEDLLRAFGVGRQVAWELFRRHARSDENDALLDAAGLLMRYVDRVSAVVTDTYLAERDALVSEDERRTRNLLDRLSSGAPLDVHELELAERLEVPVEPAYAPFAVVMPGLPPRRHAALAARLRRRGWKLTVTEGGRVVGLASKPLELADLEEGSDVLLATAEPTLRGELANARDDLVLLAEHGRQADLRGRLRAEDHLLEILMGRLPGPAAGLRGRVLAPLAVPDHEELLRTLRAFVSHHYDRAATSKALHVHRNTLAYRLRRIEEITGLDLGSARDLACVYLAIGIDVDAPAGH